MGTNINIITYAAHYCNIITQLIAGNYLGAADVAFEDFMAIRSVELDWYNEGNWLLYVHTSNYIVKWFKKLKCFEINMVLL